MVYDKTENSTAIAKLENRGTLGVATSDQSECGICT